MKTKPLRRPACTGTRPLLGLGVSQVRWWTSLRASAGGDRHLPVTNGGVAQLAKKYMGGGVRCRVVGGAFVKTESCSNRVRVRFYLSDSAKRQLSRSSQDRRLPSCERFKGRGARLSRFRFPQARRGRKGGGKGGKTGGGGLGAMRGPAGSNRRSPSPDIPEPLLWGGGADAGRVEGGGEVEKRNAMSPGGDSGKLTPSNHPILPERGGVSKPAR